VDAIPAPVTRTLARFSWISDMRSAVAPCAAIPQPSQMEAHVWSCAMLYSLQFAAWQVCRNLGLALGTPLKGRHNAGCSLSRNQKASRVSRSAGCLKVFEGVQGKGFNSSLLPSFTFCKRSSCIPLYHKRAMKLPNAENAVVDIRKLRDYCLNPDSPKGRSKARVFRAALGLTQIDAVVLRDALLEAARNQNCDLGECDDYGQRYTVDFNLRTEFGTRRVRSGWIIKVKENFPRLTTCYVLKAKATIR
jgi:hypothetical protein